MIRDVTPISLARVSEEDQLLSVAGMQLHRACFVLVLYPKFFVPRKSLQMFRSVISFSGLLDGWNYPAVLYGPYGRGGALFEAFSYHV